MLLIIILVCQVGSSVLKGSVNISRITLKWVIIEVELNTLVVGDPILVINIKWVLEKDQ